MTAAEVCDKLELLGLRGEITKTGHWDYIRVFVIDKQGVTQGRATIYRGEYSHCKWYVRKVDTGPMLDNEWYPTAFDFLLSTGTVLSRKAWKRAIVQAKKQAQARYQEKLAWRKANPPPDGKQRRALQRPNSRRFLYRNLADLIEVPF